MPRSDAIIFDLWRFMYVWQIAFARQIRKERKIDRDVNSYNIGAGDIDNDYDDDEKDNCYNDERRWKEQQQQQTTDEGEEQKSVQTCFHHAW